MVWKQIHTFIGEIKPFYPLWPPIQPKNVFDITVYKTRCPPPQMTIKT